MAGNHRSGRNTKLKKFTGPVDGPSVVIPGRVVAPQTLEGEELTAWNALISPLADRGIVTAGDMHEAQMMCEFWGLYRKALIAAKSDPLDKHARCAVKAYADEFDRIASRFGLTPSDRQRLKAPTDQKPPKLSKFTS